jgi:hypothetical protein
MPSTWVVGDIHGCAVELRMLLEQIDLQPGDRLWAVGDLFHRGPDPVGVLQLLRELGGRFDMVNGNHELAMLQRRAAGPVRTVDDLRGDGRCAIHASSLAVADVMLDFVAARPYFQRLPLSGPAWLEQPPRQALLVHGGVLPGVPPEGHTPHQLVRKLRCKDLPGAPSWVEQWRGPEFVVFGHAQSAAGPHHAADGSPSSYGLDTGCVYGGPLSAVRLEDLTVVQVPARSRD